MTISQGDKVPDAMLLETSGDKPQPVQMADKLAGRKVVVFGVPAAFSGTCSTAHVPSFMRNREKLAEKGVDEVICVAVNDCFAMKAWDETLGASKGGITMLADGMSEFTTAIGMNFSAPAVGFMERSKRYAMLIEDGIVTQLNIEAPGPECNISAAETMLDAM
ncbi:MAG: peroxiredoxin [Pseudooceanicola sp.]